MLVTFIRYTFKKKSVPKKKLPQNELGAYLGRKNISDKEIYAKTDIIPSELSKLKSGSITRLAAKKLYQISLAVGDDIQETIKETILKVMPEIATVSVDKKNVSSYNSSTLTELGELLFSMEVIENTKEIISLKTKIKLNRLRDLTSKENFILQAFELVLIEHATKKESGILFKILFKNVKLNPPEVQEKRHEEQRRRNSKIKKSKDNQ